MVNIKRIVGCTVKKVANRDSRIKRGTKLIVAGTANDGTLLRFNGIEGYHPTRFFKRVITCGTESNLTHKN